MQAFEYHNPTRIVFGQGAIRRLSHLVPQEQRVMVLYGGGSAERYGTLDEVRAALGNTLVAEFGGIEANPRYETLMRAVSIAREKKIDWLIAVGGGSVIDGSKFVAAAARYEGDSWDILRSFGSIVTRALPVGAVLTLAATGSEMNNNAVVTDHHTRTKAFFASPLVYPQFAILDPEKTYTLPQRQLANGVVDAFTHVAEQYLTYPVNARVQDRYAEGLMQTLIELAPALVSGTPDYQTHANMMWAATQALNGLIGAGVPQDWATHLAGHELTACFDMDHAQTLAVLLPSMLEVRKEAKREKLLQYAERVWHLHDGSEEERIDAAIACTRQFFQSIGVSTRLRDYGVGAADIDTLIAQLQAHGMTSLGEHGDVTPDVCRQVFELSL